jgi:hypothetical protein
LFERLASRHFGCAFLQQLHRVEWIMAGSFWLLLAAKVMEGKKKDGEMGRTNWST